MPLVPELMELVDRAALVPLPVSVYRGGEGEGGESVQLGVKGGGGCGAAASGRG